MTSLPTPSEGDHAADSLATQRLQEWRNRLNAFADEFDAEISRILMQLTDFSREEAVDIPRSKACDQTMEFSLPPAPSNTVRSPAPLPAAPSQTLDVASAGDPNRLAALKAKLSQQMATSGHAHSGQARTPEGSRS